MKYNNYNVIIYLIIFVIMNGVKAQGMKKKILCLHGGGSSGPAFQSQTGMKNLMWPPGATACPLLTSDGGCSGDTCCGAGTIYKDGKCVASYKDMKNACKDGGINGWKCESTTDDSCDHK